jgi:pyruvate/2-oxoglutarate/acetoin dehydrogenase E1 component
MSKYFEQLCIAMGWLAKQKRTVFMGQAVEYPGTAMFTTLRDVPPERRLELPVFEDTQMGMAIGMSLAGDVPIAIYPRWNFLLCAANQLVLHLDKIPSYSRGGYLPKVIIRTSVGTDQPLDPGHQHLGDYSEAFRMMLRTVRVIELTRAEQIVDEYERAFYRPGSTILVEHMGAYA